MALMLFGGADGEPKQTYYFDLAKPRMYFTRLAI